MSFTDRRVGTARRVNPAAATLVPVKLENSGGRGAAGSFFNDVMWPKRRRNWSAPNYVSHSCQVCCDATVGLHPKRDLRRSSSASARTNCKKSASVHPLDPESQRAGHGTAILTVRTRARGTSNGAPIRRRDRACAAVARRSRRGLHRTLYPTPPLLPRSLRQRRAREEIFGPVAYLAEIETEEESDRDANDTDYGLANKRLDERPRSRRSCRRTPGRGQQLDQRPTNVFRPRRFLYGGCE